MRHYFASWVVLLLAVSCGGSSETTDFSVAGSGPGGTSQGGSSSAGSAPGGSAGKGSGGSASGGSASGGSSTAGTSSAGTGTSGSTGQAGATSGGSGGTGTVDPKCPATRPTEGSCESGTSCQYDYANCLCYPTAPGTFIQCQKVNPNCPAGTGGAPAAAPAEGTGGVSAKIALPPRQVCTCSSGSWMCAFGI